MQQIVTSASNSTVKRVRKLATNSKARHDTGEYIADGIHLTRSLLQSTATPVLYIYAESAQKNAEVTELVQQLNARSVHGVAVTDNLFESFATVHANVGILTIFRPQQTANNSDAISRTTVILEDVQDPGNMGTILRTAAAAGVGQAVLSAKSASPWSPKALRAGMGAQFGLAIHESTDLLATVSSAAIPTLATTLSPDSRSLYDIDLKQPVAWIFGNEGQGVSQQLAAAASQRILIPQADTSVESLNVAAAAAVCLYEQYRQISIS